MGSLRPRALAAGGRQQAQWLAPPLPCTAAATASIKKLIQFLACVSPSASCNARIDLEPGQPY